MKYPLMREVAVEATKLFAVQAFAKDRGLSLMAVLALFRLKKNRASHIRLNHLREQTGLGPVEASRVLRCLLDQKLVEIRISSEDARERLIKVTDHGVVLLADIEDSLRRRAARLPAAGSSTLA